MILEPKKITTAYRCRGCGDTVYGIAGAVALTGDIIKLKCECGESELVIKNIPDGKVRITVPCMFCRNDHTFVISKKLLLSKELFTYPCPYTGIDVCFFGTDENVRDTVEESDRQINELITEEDLEKYGEVMDENSREETDEHMRDMITLVLGELADDNAIICDCGTAHDLLVRDGNDFVEIECKKCGCRRRYYCDSSVGTQDLFFADRIRLVKEDE